MNEDRNVNSDSLFLDYETIRSTEQDEIVDPRVFFALSNDLLVIAGSDGYFHRLNRAWEKTTGYTIEELRSRPFLDFVHPEDRPQTLDTAKKNFSGAEIKSFENRYICKDGSIKWFLWNSVPSKQANLTYAVAHDITDRKKVESELLDLSLALSNALEGIAKIDASAEFISTNKSFAQQLGYEPAELTGVHWQNIVVPASLRDLLAAYEQMRTNGKATFEAQALRKDGKTFYAEVTVVSTLDDKQQFSGHHCFMKDISERKQAAVNLEQSEARFRSLSAQLPGIVYQFVVTTSGYRHFPYISDSCKTITGYDAVEIQQNPNLALAMVHPDDLSGLKKQIFESIGNRQPYSFEGRIITKQGELKWIQASTSPELLNTDDVLWNSILTDITELKTADEKIKQLNDDLARRVNRLSDVNHELGLLTQKLELAYDQALEASKLKSEFVANISHEVRTPLSAVIGMADLLLDTRLTAEQQEFARIVKESAQSLLTIINDILDFSKMEAGKMELEVVEFDLLALVEGCVELLASSARDKALNLITYLDPAIPRVMRGDPVRLRQVLLNLTSNAIKFTEFGKVIIKVELTSQTSDAIELRFSVKDTGVGISSEAKDVLFQPFMQADGSTTRKYGGTGLGLSISKRLVELMDGAIGVESEFGTGANFFFTVSLFRSDQRTTILDVLSTKALADKRCLIIDENDSLTHAVTPYLHAIDVKTTVVLEPQKAVFQLKSALLQAVPFNLLIVDFDRKNADTNRAYFEAIAASARDSRTPVIYLINFDERERVLKSLKTSFASSFLTKPIRQMAFYQMVSELLSHNDHTAEDWDDVALTGFFNDQTNSGTRFSSLPSSSSLTNSQPSREVSATSSVNGGSQQHAATAQAEEFARATIDANWQPSSKSSPALEALSNPVQELPTTPENSRTERILLAEDNVIMQKLALQQLEKLGYKVTAVKNGKEVLEALKEKQYKMILMDCQMPVIDGFETTKIIRAEEKSSGKHIPVVALTASAMQGDEDICYAAGMDDYLCKPVDRNQLRLMIDKWCPELKEETEAAPVVPEDKDTDQNGSKLFDIPQLISLYGKASIPELLNSFISEGNTLLTATRQALTTHDLQELKVQAHTFKGMAAVLTAVDLAQISLNIEQAAKTASFTDAERHVDTLEKAFKSAEAAIHKILQAENFA